MNNVVKDIIVSAWIILFSVLAGLGYLNINETSRNFSKIATVLNRQIAIVRSLDQATTQRFNRTQVLLNDKQDKE